ncbi:MAG TPA: helix-turn-helix transcriptional regulator [Polyangiaceae bacterium]|nr:helix-turn-helix transcriptional regulator [Polyangiaceae bacterium]
MTNKGWSQRDLATKSGVSANYISLLIKGDRGTRGLTLSTAQKIASAAEIDLQWLMSGEGEPLPGSGPQMPSPDPPALVQALTLLGDRIAQPVRVALRAERPAEPWGVREWIARAKELQEIYDSLPQDFNKK